VCTENPNIIQRPPSADFDTLTATGTGTCNGLPATIQFVLVDGGEPGTRDTARYLISGGCTLNVAATNLTFGNQQAHNG
jgi:hypothetical protein